FDAEEVRGVVDRGHELEVRLGHLVESAGAHDARVVDEYVKSAVFEHRLVYHRLDALLVGDVRAYRRGDTRAEALAELVSARLGTGFIHIGDYDIRALLGHCLGYTLAKALRTAGYKRDLALEPLRSRSGERDLGAVALDFPVCDEVDELVRHRLIAA